MTFLKHTIHKTETNHGFVFTKWHAIGLALFFILFFVSSYLFQQWIKAGSFDEITGYFKKLSFFRKSADVVIAKECTADKPYYSESSGNCSELCPVPLVPNDQGHCIK
jgi:hypothetical protein